MRLVLYTQSDTFNNTENQNHLKITQTVPEQLPGKHDNKEVQNAAILDTVQTFQLFVWDTLVRIKSDSW